MGHPVKKKKKIRMKMAPKGKLLGSAFGSELGRMIRGASGGEDRLWESWVSPGRRG